MALRPLHRCSFAPCIGLLLIALVGCKGEADDATEDQSAQQDTTPTEPESPWLEGADGPTVLMPSPEKDEVLRNAIKEARETMDDARAQWTAAKEAAAVAGPETMNTWLIKWAAATTDGTIEYLWVSPETWTEFRIEGILINKPTLDLVNQATLGDRVSFPAEDLADWMEITDPTDPNAFNGGITHRLMVDRFGPAPEQPASQPDPHHRAPDAHPDPDSESGADSDS